MAHSTSDIISSFENEQKNTVFSALSEYLSTGHYVDISLVCKGQVLRAHKVVLSSSSKYFKDFFRHQPGVNIIDLDKELAPNDLSLTLEDVQLIIGILYCVGTVEISPQRIETLLICAQVLGIPTLISFLKKIRETIGDNGTKIVKEQPIAMEYHDSCRSANTLLTTNLLSPIQPPHKILAPPQPQNGTFATPGPVRAMAGSSPRPSLPHGRVGTPGPSSSSGPSQRASKDVMYLLPSRDQFPGQRGPSGNSGLGCMGSVQTVHHPLVAAARDSCFTGSNNTSFNSRRSASPMIDLSVVKPLTASCINTPVPQDEQQIVDSRQRPGSSRGQQTGHSSRVSDLSHARGRNLGSLVSQEPTDQQEITPPSGIPSLESRGRRVQDSLLCFQSLQKVDPEAQRISLQQREASGSRISSASFSSFTGLSYLQSPRLKSTEAPSVSGDNQTAGSLDGFDQNFLMTLSTLQANQIDDLENVLLPHLSMDGGRSDSTLNNQLLDLNQIDDVEDNQDNGNKDISTTTPEGGRTPCSMDDNINGPHSNISSPLVENSPPDDHDDEDVEDDEDSDDGNDNDNNELPELENISTVVHDSETICYNTSNKNMESNQGEEGGMPGEIVGQLMIGEDIEIHNTPKQFNNSKPNLQRYEGSDCTSVKSNKIKNIIDDVTGNEKDITSQTYPTMAEKKQHKATCEVLSVQKAVDLGVSPDGEKENESKAREDKTVRNPELDICKQKDNSNKFICPAKDTELFGDNMSSTQSMPVDDLNTSENMSNSTSHSPEHSSHSFNSSFHNSFLTPQSCKTFGYRESTETFTGTLASPTPGHYSPVTPVRITPGIINNPNQNMIATPVRLTPQGGIALTPIKKLMQVDEGITKVTSDRKGNADQNKYQTSANEEPKSLEEDSVDEHDGAVNNVEHSSEIVMNLDTVCEGQKMKFSIPGISQAVTVNFSVEALQEMKNAALKQNSLPNYECLGSSDQHSEISSSEKSNSTATTSRENVDIPLVSKVTKKKKLKRNLRQKLKSNLRSPRPGPIDDTDFVKPYKFLCPICNQTFASVIQLSKHQKFHVQKGFSCDPCQELFDARWQYDQHLAEKHGKTIENAQCPECDEEFSQRNLLLAHLQTFHKDKKVFKCFVCNLEFNKKHNLLTHLGSWHPTEKIPSCEVCKDIFTDENSIDTHDCPGAEITNRKITCHLHDKPIGFTSRNELEKHMDTEHGGAEKASTFNVSCCICHKKFLLRKNLLKHLRNVHKQGDNKHFCPKCGKQFYYKDDLKNHLLVHEGDLKHICKEGDCNKAYSTIKALKKHEKNYHNTDISLVTCSICKKQLSTKFKLRTHMLVHSTSKPFGCSSCSEKFKEKRSVIKHMKLKHGKDNDSLTTNPEESNTEDVSEICSELIENSSEMCVNNLKVSSLHQEEPPLGDVDTQPDSTEVD